MLTKLLCSVTMMFALAACTTCGETSPPPPPPPAGGGTLVLSWFLTAPSQALVPCATAGATKVSAALRRRSTGDVVTTDFSCAGTGHVVTGLTPDTYDVTLQLFTADGDLLAAAGTTLPIGINDRATTSASVTFSLRSLSGTLTIALEALGASANCTAPTTSGAGIDTMTLVLQHATGECAPITLTRTRDGVPRGTYTIDCEHPTAQVCAEYDEVLSAQRLDSGPYILRAVGMRGNRQCWTGSSVLSVPAGHTAAHMLQMLRRPNEDC